MIGVTPVGPVEALRQIASTAPDQFVMELRAPAAKLSLYDAVLQLNGAELTATCSATENCRRRASSILRISSSKVRGSTAVKLDFTLDQRFVVTEVNEGGAFDMAAWLKDVRRLSLTAAADEGVLGRTAWHMGELTARIGPVVARGRRQYNRQRRERGNPGRHFLLCGRHRAGAGRGGAGRDRRDAERAGDRAARPQGRRAGAGRFAQHILPQGAGGHGSCVRWRRRCRLLRKRRGGRWIARARASR